MQPKHSAIGVDLGSSRFVIASVLRGGVEILANEASYRSTPCLVSFGAERMIGDKAKAKVKSNIKNAVFYPSRQIGLKTDEEFVKERPFNYCSVRKNDAGKLDFNLMYEGEKKAFSSEQVLACVLTQVKRVLDLNQVVSSEVVLSVPSYATHSERQAILDAAKVAGVHVIRLYNESTANVMNYGIFRKADLDQSKPRLVGFVDFGESKTSVFFAKIYKNKAEIVLEINDRHLGTRNLDANMADFYCKLFEQRNNIDLRENPKSMYRLHDAIEKQRKVLSANSDSTLNIECLCEDIDFTHNMTREEFEKINAPVFERFAKLLKQATEQLGSELKNLHSIERIGGGSRIQLIEAMTIDTFKIKGVSKTLDAAESISRGCAIQAAMLSPNYQVTPYEIKERNYYPISAELSYQGDEQNKKVATLFKKGHNLDSTLTISIKKPLPLSVSLKENGAVDMEVLSASVEAMKPKHENFEGKLWFLLNKNGLAELLRAEMVEKFKVQEKVPKAKAKKEAKDAKNDKKMDIEEEESKKMDIEQEEEFELKEKDKTQTTLLAVNRFHPLALDEETINGLVKQEDGMRKKEQLLIDTYNSKYFLESFIYETRNLINEGDNVKFTTQDEKNAILQKLADAETWLYSEGMNTTKEEYDARLGDVRKLGDIFYNRYNKIKDAEALYHEAFPAFSSFETNNSELLTHGTSLQLNEIATKMDESISYLEDMKKVVDQFSIGQTDQFDLQKVKSVINDNFKALNNILQSIKKDKEEAERKKKEEEKKQEEEKKKQEEEKKAQAKKESEEKKDDNKMQEEPVEQ